MNANKPTLYLIRGVSGSGKSTLALRLCEDVVETAPARPAVVNHHARQG